MSIPEFRELKISDVGNSERKRRLVTPHNNSPQSSLSEDTVSPPNKIGKSSSSLSVSDTNTLRSHSSTSSMRANNVTGFLISYDLNNTVRDGLRHVYSRKLHECSAIIEDINGIDGKNIVCKVKCPLADSFESRYPLVHTNCNKLIVSTGRNCLDISIREIALLGIKCLEYLYKGVHSNIFVGYNELSHKYVAVKLTNSGDHRCKRELRGCSPCFETKHNADEITYLRQFRHPNIISILSEFDTKPGKKAIILEFCSIGRLSRLLDKTKVITETVAAKYFRQMFQAVKYMHEQGYAVRNISLKHFLLSDSNQIKLVDLSRVFPLSQIETHYSEGIPGYQAPELLNYRLNAYHPERADIWALGACLYSMITGTLTTVNHSLAPSYSAAFSYSQSVRHILSEGIYELLAGMLEYLPEHRFTNRRIEHSDWYFRTSYNTSITGFYLLRQSHKHRLNKYELENRQEMEL